MNLLLQTCSDSSIVPQECLSFFKFSTDLSLPSQTDHWCAGISETQRGWSSSALRPKTEIPLLAAGWQRKWRWNLRVLHNLRVSCSLFRNCIPRVTKTKKKNKTWAWQTLTIDAVTALCCVSQTLTLAKGSQLGWSSWQQTRQTQPLMWSQKRNCWDWEPQLANSRVVLKHPLTNTPTAAPGAVVLSIKSHLVIYKI